MDSSLAAMLHSTFALAAVCCFSLTPALAQTVYVNASLTTGANDGSSWANAFQGEGGLDAGLIARSAAGQVWVAQGRYKPSVDVSGGRFTYDIDGSVRLYGGFVGGETTIGERPPVGSAETILDGDLLGDDLAPSGTTADNSRHVLLLSDLYGRFDRITVEGGFAWNPGSEGGAVHIEGGTASSVTFIDCNFRGNSAQYRGGAMYAELMVNSDLHLLRCKFLDNRVGTEGGGLWAFTEGRLTMNACDFRGNSAGGGGGCWLVGSSEVEIHDSLFAMNESRGLLGAGALYAANHAGAQKVTMDGCTVYGNQALTSFIAGVDVGTVELDMTNSIVWGNTGSGGNTQIYTGTGIPNFSVSYSIIQDWTAGGTGVLTSDPLLADPMGGNFEPGAGSPAVDAGGPLNPAMPGIGDLLSNRRRVDDPTVADTGAGPAPMVDIGAVERGVGAIGTAVCVVDPNSTGGRGKLDAYGSNAAADNDFTLVATDLPPNQFGIFIVSRDVGFIPTTSGPTLCLTGTIARIMGPGQILSSGAAGEFSLTIDLNAMPTQTAFTSVMPGQSWSFQGWHRDGAGTMGSGFTDATTVDFR